MKVVKVSRVSACQDMTEMNKAILTDVQNQHTNEQRIEDMLCPDEHAYFREAQALRTF